MAIIKARVINIDSEKLDHVSLEMKKIGFDWERVAGCTPTVEYSKKFAISYSHLFALYGVKGNLLICEDDVTFIDNARELFDEAFSQLPDDWDMFYLGGNVKRLARPYSKNLFRISYGVHCTHAVLYTERARDLILNSYDIYESYTKDYDHWLFCEGQGLMKCYICYPVIAYQGDDYYDDMKENELKHLI